MLRRIALSREQSEKDKSFWRDGFDDQSGVLSRPNCIDSAMTLSNCFRSLPLGRNHCEAFGSNAYRACLKKPNSRERQFLNGVTAAPSALSLLCRRKACGFFGRRPRTQRLKPPLDMASQCLWMAGCELVASLTFNFSESLDSGASIRASCQLRQGEFECPGCVGRSVWYARQWGPRGGFTRDTSIQSEKLIFGKGFQAAWVEGHNILTPICRAGTYPQ